METPAKVGSWFAGWETVQLRPVLPPAATRHSVAEGMRGRRAMSKVKPQASIMRSRVVVLGDLLPLM